MFCRNPSIELPPTSPPKIYTVSPSYIWHLFTVLLNVAAFEGLSKRPWTWAPQGRLGLPRSSSLPVSRSYEAKCRLWLVVNALSSLESSFRWRELPRIAYAFAIPHIKQWWISSRGSMGCSWGADRFPFRHSCSTRFSCHYDFAAHCKVDFLRPSSNSADAIGSSRECLWLCSFTCEFFSISPSQSKCISFSFYFSHSIDTHTHCLRFAGYTFCKVIFL